MLFATTRSAAADERLSSRDRRRPGDAEERRILTVVVMRLLQLEDGSFIFQSGIEPVRPVSTTHAVGEILRDADALTSEWNAMEAAIGSVAQPYCLEPWAETDGDIVLSPDEWQVLATIGDGRSAAEVADAAALPEFDVARCFVALVERKLIVPGEATADAEPSERDVVPAQDAVERLGTRKTETVDTGEPQHVETMPPPIMRGRGAPPRPASGDGVVLDLTAQAEQVPAGSITPTEEEEEPASELARRWRNLRRGVRDEESPSE